MAPLHVATLTVQRELPKYEMWPLIINNYVILVDDPVSFIPKTLSAVNSSYEGQLMGFSLKSFGSRIVVSIHAHLSGSSLQAVDRENLWSTSVSSITVERELPELLASKVSLPYLCIKMAPLHVATLTVKRELPKY